MKVRLLASAMAELEEAAAYYDRSRPALGDALYDKVETALTFIAEYPEASPKTTHGGRRYNLKRFPYFLIYRVAVDEIVVGVIGHAHRSPGYWHDRDFD